VVAVGLEAVDVGLETMAGADVLSGVVVRVPAGELLSFVAVFESAWLSWLESGSFSLSVTSAFAAQDEAAALVDGSVPPSAVVDLIEGLRPNELTRRSTLQTLLFGASPSDDASVAVAGDLRLNELARCSTARQATLTRSWRACRARSSALFPQARGSADTLALVPDSSLAAAVA